jgi:hypothetical protein
MALDEAGRRLWVELPAERSLAAIDVVTGAFELVAEVDPDVEMAVNPNGGLFVREDQGNGRAPHRAAPGPSPLARSHAPRVD